MFDVCVEGYAFVCDNPVGTYPVHVVEVNIVESHVIQLLKLVKPTVIVFDVGRIGASCAPVVSMLPNTY